MLRNDKIGELEARLRREINCKLEQIEGRLRGELQRMVMEGRGARGRGGAARRDEDVRGREPRGAEGVSV